MFGRASGAGRLDRDQYRLRSGLLDVLGGIAAVVRRAAAFTRLEERRQGMYTPRPAGTNWKRRNGCPWGVSAAGTWDFSAP